MAWVKIPEDAIAWFSNAFAEANRITTEAISNVPNIRETSLDDSFIQALVPRSAPTLLGSGSIVRMDIHNIGGLRRVTRWEIADIGLVVFIIRSGQIIAQKLALLQAKRLYPKNNEIDDDDPAGFRYGFNALLKKDPSPTSMALVRRFDFDTGCKYGALKAGSEQQSNTEDFFSQFGHNVDYLLYNPVSLPLSVAYPLVARHTVDSPPILGCRVVSRKSITETLAALSDGESPSFDQILKKERSGGLRVEEWAADLLRCKVGKQYSAADEFEILPIIERRSGPIGAAIAVSIELPRE